MREIATRAVVILAGLALAWYFYVKVLLGQVTARHWSKPWWLNVILVFGTPVLFGVVAGFLFHSRLVGLLFLTPLIVPLFLIGGFLVIWACEQWTIRQMLRQER